MPFNSRARAICEIPIRVSVLHWNRPEECLATLSHLRNSQLNLRITVIDNNSKPESFDRLRKNLPAGVDLIQLSANVGWGKAHNVALRRWLRQEPDSPYCLICAHDPVPVGTCLEQLIAALENDSNLGIASPEYGSFEVPCFSVLRGAHLKQVSPRDYGVVEAADYCHGTLAVFRKECLKEIGIFDESYFAYGDETEIGVRANRRGWKTGIVWGAVLHNPGSWSGNALIAYLWTRSSLRMARKFYGPAGLLLRLAYIMFVTVVLWIRNSPLNGLSSPRARLLAVRDYLMDYHGPPTDPVLKLKT
jgi:N-acetylglucosaminyl-diphospho-decaprenol L-rhamnosyltransferase